MSRLIVPLGALLELVGGASLAGAPAGEAKTLDRVATVDVRGARALLEGGALFFDVRSFPKWHSARIPGAANVIAARLREADLSTRAGKDTPLVFYGEGKLACDAVPALRLARRWGYDGVRWLKEGFAGWLSAGYPIETPRSRARGGRSSPLWWPGA